MTTHFGMRLAVAAFLILVVWMAAASVAGQGRSSRVDRALMTSDGQPDLQGVWTNNGVTPLQRPEAFKDRQFLTDAELDQLKRRSSELFERQQAGDLIGDRLFQEFVKDPNLRPFDPDTGNYNSFWLVGRSFDNRTSLIIDPPNGRLPPRVATADQGRRPRPTTATSGPANPEDLSLGERCITYGVPWLVAGYNSYFEIFQTPNHVAILQEMIHDVRIIPLDGQPHADGRVRLWNGDSRGRFEGDTLVVTTTNYSPKTRLQGSSENLRLVERFKRVSADTLEYRLTFEDGKVWTAQWTMQIPLKRSNDRS